MCTACATIRCSCPVEREEIAALCGMIWRALTQREKRDAFASSGSLEEVIILTGIYLSLCWRISLRLYLT
ncbi:hypothetical protein NTGM5_10192 [Candidatus Nitrotoga sp. M5]|nr:hypothetical protein NTGM5_10192 [Candidatus Nitrotoga sp. M5]